MLQAAEKCLMTQAATAGNSNSIEKMMSQETCLGCILPTCPHKVFCRYTTQQSAEDIVAVAVLIADREACVASALFPYAREDPNALQGDACMEAFFGDIHTEDGLAIEGKASLVPQLSLCISLKQSIGRSDKGSYR